MKYDLNVYTWKLLRILVRAKGSPKLGRELRHVPSRNTKDGRFLDALVTAGLLLKLDTLPLIGSGLSASKPEQFRTFYALTETGEKAAEFGEVELPPEVRKVVKWFLRV